MYTPKHFEERRPEAIRALVAAHPLATLVTLTGSGLVANHIPLHLREDGSPLGTLVGHIARANRLWSDHAPGIEALAIFQGPDAYITPNDYPGKREHGRAVPTWNYVTVHAYGPLRVIEDAAWLREQLEGLTDAHEAAFAHPWQVGDAPADYTAGMIKAIVGIEIAITRVEAKWKVSQNQPEANRAGVVAGLRAREDAAARAMADLVAATLGGDKT